VTLGRKICLSLLVLCAVNFFIFVAVAEHLGGDAINGKVENGRYYLTQHHRPGASHQTTEVTRSVFIYSRWHARSVWVTHPLGMILFVVCFGNKLRGKKKAARPQP
jgi:hypothetical protein